MMSVYGIWRTLKGIRFCTDVKPTTAFWHQKHIRTRSLITRKKLLQKAGESYLKVQAFLLKAGESCLRLGTFKLQASSFVSLIKNTRVFIELGPKSQKGSSRRRNNSLSYQTRTPLCVHRTFTHHILIPRLWGLFSQVLKIEQVS
jgi:hypothetical protein